MNTFYIFFLFVLTSCFVKGDLPIHALMGDVSGIWKIKQTRKMSQKPEHCGGGIPNRNLDNLKPSIRNYERFLENEYGNLDTKIINLTLEKVKIINQEKPRDKWTYLSVRDYEKNEIIGTWTMVYDEGFEIRLNGSKYFAFFKYERKSNAHCPTSIEDKSYNDRDCYKTNPTQTHIGWVLDEKVNENKNEKKFHWGCFYAEKKESAPVSSFVLHNGRENKTNLEDSHEYHFEEKKKKNLPSIGRRSNYKKFRFSNLQKIYGSTQTHLRDIYGSAGERKYACRKKDLLNLKIRLTLPKEFSWGDPFNDENFEENVDDQKDCGSCYSISSVYSLERRFEILFWKKYKKKVNMPRLSHQSILSCSPYNQGCDGGYPFLVGKHLYEYGIIPERYMHYENNDNNNCIMDMGNYNNLNEQNRNIKEIYYVSDYNYINGCYECTNEYEMMNEIILNGPIVAAINATSELLNFYNIDDKNLVYDILPKDTHQVCDIHNKGFNGWQQTNHAINIVGWGEQIINKDKIKNDEPNNNYNNNNNDNNQTLIKYWIIRNTWGKKWGYKGYLKFQRGINLAGIESQAVYIDPDFSRGYPKDILQSDLLE
ncbi:dipeptidyl aminopeptidase 2 [Plasmodium gaboni]|uniref:Dipeptidyl peptidase 1 n=1 Tax=Plasmodium gaboni TaxID=647221 RepID=A0A151LHC8_9APIC|nr:dipeptidyl aminopeptidase 2 [Plasmodium gaboni]KYN98259.1 dipeptidyl aminopeptidase 2 [Plasmodium gaboni]